MCLNLYFVKSSNIFDLCVVTVCVATGTELFMFYLSKDCPYLYCCSRLILTI